MSAPSAPFSVDDVAFGPDGLAAVVAQDAASGEVLMLAWADREALEATLASGEAHYHSRSRDELWRKGASSGNVQRVVEVRLDCDGDALLYQVEQTGPACHTGQRSCFHRPLSRAEDGVPAEGFGLLQRVVDQRLRDLPDGSYVARMHAKGLGYVAQKVVEEAGETIVAALEDRSDELRGEAADLLFHLTVLLRERDLSLADVGETLIARHRERDAG